MKLSPFLQSSRFTNVMDRHSDWMFASSFKKYTQNIQFFAGAPPQ
jgi:hypothetical protein